MHSTQLKCAVVGLGIGEQHALAILDNPNCFLSNIIDFDEKKVRGFVASHPLVVLGSGSFEDVLNDSEVSLISLASFDDHHYEQVKACLAADKHIFVEKPLCQTKEQLGLIHQEWKKKQCGIASNLVLRTSPLYQYVKKLIAQGKLGDLYAFDGDYLYGRLHKITEGWRRSVDQYSVMQGGGIHMIDLMIWLTDSKPTTVSSCSNKIATYNTAFRYHDFHTAVFSFEGGLIGRITANFGCMHRHQHVVRIFGTKGTFIYDDMGARIHWSMSEASQPEFIEKLAKPLKKCELMHEFVEKVIKMDFQKLVQREFDLMSAVLAADEALQRNDSLAIEYLEC